MRSTRYPHQSKLAHRKEILNIENSLVNFFVTLHFILLNGFIINIKIKSGKFEIPNGIFKLLKSFGLAQKCYGSMGRWKCFFFLQIETILPTFSKEDKKCIRIIRLHSFYFPQSSFIIFRIER